MNNGRRRVVDAKNHAEQRDKAKVLAVLMAATAENKALTNQEIAKACALPNNERLGELLNLLEDDDLVEWRRVRGQPGRWSAKVEDKDVE